MLGVFNIWGHRKYSDLLSLYIDGQLEGPQLGRLESHLATCPSCQADLETLKSTVGLLRSLPSASPMRSFTLAAAPSVPQGTPAYLWSMRLATSVAAFALVFMFVGNSLGTFTREIVYIEEPASPESAEEVPPMDGAADAESAVTLESASPESGAPQLVPTPDTLTNKEEEVLPVVALEVALGVLLVILGTLTIAATRLYRRHRAAA